MEERVFNALRHLAGQSDDPRLDRVLQHFGCMHLSTVMYRLWATDDPAAKRQMEEAIARIVEDPDSDSASSGMEA